MGSLKYMQKYSEPQIFIVNNGDIANKLSESYNIEIGNLGINKVVDFGEYVRTRYVNLEYKTVDNLHEYSVIIIDLQNENETRNYINNKKEVENAEYLFELNYPKQIFNPTSLVLHFMKNNMRVPSLKIIFAGSAYTETYDLVKVLNQQQYSHPEKHVYNVYEVIQSNVISKYGKKIISVNHKLSNLIMKYTSEYKAIFHLPYVWDSDSQKSIIDPNFIPLLKNQDDEVISYIGYSKNSGYELLLPVCDKKDELIDELLTSYLPEILPEIFPESKEFEWIKDKEFMHKEIFEIEEKKKDAKAAYESRIQLLNSKIDEINQQYKFLNDLLTATGEELVQAICKYFDWLGYTEVKAIDGSEDVLREDIQIIDNEKMYIIEVKGIGGTSTDSECAQVAKHRRKREKEYPDKTIIPIYIVNHQRYKSPALRQNPPFSKDQIDYALSDERGLLTTWQLYKQYRLIEDKIFTKEETRDALYEYGVISLIPRNLKYIGTYSEYFKKPKAGILILNKTKIKVGDEVYAKKDERWIYTKINSIRVNDIDVEYAESGEVGLVTDIELENGYEIFKRDIEDKSSNGEFK